MANTVGKLGDKLIAGDLQEIEKLWNERAFAGRKGRGAIDSVMLMDQLRRENAGSDVYGRDIHSAFNSIDTKIMCGLVEDRDLRRWVRGFLAPRFFQITSHRRVDNDWRYTTRVTTEPEHLHNLHVSHG